MYTDIPVELDPSLIRNMKLGNNYGNAFRMLGICIVIYRAYGAYSYYCYVIVVYSTSSVPLFWSFKPRKVVLVSVSGVTRD